MLPVHSAHRFRLTLYDGLQVKLRKTVAFCCYGAAVLGAIVFVILIALA